MGEKQCALQCMCVPGSMIVALQEVQLCLRQPIEAAITKETVGWGSTTSQCSESHKDLNATLAPAWRD